MELVATCLFGLEKLVGEQIDALGYKRLSTIDGRVCFEGDALAVARCNINFRYAERLFIKLGEFKATTFAELFDGVYALPWESFIGARDAFPVSGHSVKSRLFSIPDCQKIVKKAIVKRLGDKYGIKWFEETGVCYSVEFFILNDLAWLMIDTSGVALHKRGYRLKAGGAPLRETLAAALAAMSRPRDNVLFCDPFCGSGTIPIEAAMLMKNIAPGLKRDFVSKGFPLVDKRLWDMARDEAKSLIKADCDFRASASDIDPACVELARQNALRAGVSEVVSLSCRDALTVRTEGKRGSIITNPPYGERLGTINEAEELYKKMGRHFATLDSWQIYVITSCEDFQRLYGRRADKVRKLYNGMIKCNFYQYFKKFDK